MNLYGFVKNQALVNIDYIGLRDIHVDYCSIHIHYGHLSKAKGKTIHWLFNGKCNFGGAIGCFPDVNNPPDVEQRNNKRGIYPDSHQVPGIPTHGNGVQLMNEHRDEAIMRVATLNGTSNENEMTARHRNHSEEHGMPFILDNAANLNNIQILVDELCRKDGCCCKEVRFTLHIDGSGALLDSKIQSGIDRFSNVWKNKIKVGEKFIKTFKCGENVILP